MMAAALLQIQFSNKAKSSNKPRSSRLSGVYQFLSTIEAALILSITNKVRRGQSPAYSLVCKDQIGYERLFQGLCDVTSHTDAAQLGIVD